jgi:hypothetical protein
MVEFLTQGLARDRVDGCDAKAGIGITEDHDVVNYMRAFVVVLVRIGSPFQLFLAKGARCWRDRESGIRKRRMSLLAMTDC